MHIFRKNQEFKFGFILSKMDVSRKVNNCD